MGKISSVVRNVLLWTYGRGTWQYDLMCVLILGFVLLTPKVFLRPTSDVVTTTTPHQGQVTPQSEAPTNTSVENK